MSSASRTEPIILDCTLRDGGYVNNWRFSADIARDVYRSLSKSGVDIVELGFHGTEAHFDPAEFGPWRFSREEHLRQATENIRGAAVCLMGDYGKIDPDDLPDRNNSCVSLVRVAAHKDRVGGALALLRRIRDKGYEVSFQCMGYSTYTETEKAELQAALADTEIDYFYIADSYGSLFPSQIEGLFEPYLTMGRFKVGFHPHNSIQMAFANTLEAIRAGVDIVDCSLYGMGRGAGNLPTEILLSYLIAEGANRYNVIPILNCIERHFLDLMKEFPWGYRLPYMISGIFNSHPSYAKDMLRRREYSMEDIWRVMECVEEMRPVGFDGAIVDTLIGRGVVGGRGGAAEEQETPAKEKPAGVRVSATRRREAPYENRHAGREFLVLANGPGLKEHKPFIGRYIEKYDPVVLGANYLAGLFVPQYHGFSNKKRFVSYVGAVAPESALLIGTNIPRDMIADHTGRPYEPLIFRDVLDADFDIRDGVIMTNCRTISVLLVGVAVVMGASRVHVAGMDGYLHKETVTSALFYDEKFDVKEYDLNVERHRWNEKFLSQIDAYLKEHGGEGVHILTPTSHEAFYKSISNYVR